MHIFAYSIVLILSLALYSLMIEQHLPISIPGLRAVMRRSSCCAPGESINGPIRRNSLDGDIKLRRVNSYSSRRGSTELPTVPEATTTASGKQDENNTNTNNEKISIPNGMTLDEMIGIRNAVKQSGYGSPEISLSAQGTPSQTYRKENILITSPVLTPRMNYPTNITSPLGNISSSTSSVAVATANGGVDEIPTQKNHIFDLIFQPTATATNNNDDNHNTNTTNNNNNNPNSNPNPPNNSLFFPSSHFNTTNNNNNTNSNTTATNQFQHHMSSSSAAGGSTVHNTLPKIDKPFMNPLQAILGIRPSTASSATAFSSSSSSQQAGSMFGKQQQQQQQQGKGVNTANSASESTLPRMMASNNGGGSTKMRTIGDSINRLIRGTGGGTTTGTGGGTESGGENSSRSNSNSRRRSLGDVNDIITQEKKNTNNSYRSALNAPSRRPSSLFQVVETEGSNSNKNSGRITSQRITTLSPPVPVTVPAVPIITAIITNNATANNSANINNSSSSNQAK